MTHLPRGKLFEAAFWLGFAVFAYALTYSFDRTLETYRFGAAGWPRALIVLIALAAIGQLAEAVLRPEGPAAPAARDPADEPTRARDASYFLRVALIMLLPVLYAASLDYTGFYVTTPVFLVVYLFVIGERRPPYLVGVPLLIYALLLLFFTKLLFVGLPVGNWHPFYDISNALLVLLR